jgi:hypothetical protein
MSLDKWTIITEALKKRDKFMIRVPRSPKASTWAMLLIGYAGVGFMAHRRRNGALSDPQRHQRAAKSSSRFNPEREYLA